MTDIRCERNGDDESRERSDEDLEGRPTCVLTAIFAPCRSDKLSTMQDDIEEGKLETRTEIKETQKDDADEDTEDNPESKLGFSSVQNGRNKKEIEERKRQKESACRGEVGGDSKLPASPYTKWIEEHIFGT